MKKKLWLIATLLIITSALVCIYLYNRDTTKPGELMIKSPSGTVTLTLSDVKLSHVTGEIKNKKGEVKSIDSEGFALADVPALAGVSDYQSISVYADDEYSASLTKDEVSAPDKAWLIKSDDALRLIVFGDDNSKRDVKNVVRIEIQ